MAVESFIKWTKSKICSFYLDWYLGAFSFPLPQIFLPLWFVLEMYKLPLESLEIKSGAATVEDGILVSKNRITTLYNNAYGTQIKESEAQY